MFSAFLSRSNPQHDEHRLGIYQCSQDTKLPKNNESENEFPVQQLMAVGEQQVVEVASQTKVLRHQAMLPPSAQAPQRTD